MSRLTKDADGSEGYKRLDPPLKCPACKQTGEHGFSFMASGHKRVWKDSKGKWFESLFEISDYGDEDSFSCDDDDCGYVGSYDEFVVGD